MKTIGNFLRLRKKYTSDTFICSPLYGLFVLVFSNTSLVKFVVDAGQIRIIKNNPFDLITQ